MNYILPYNIARARLPFLQVKVEVTDKHTVSRYRTGSGSDRILHSTCDLQFRVKETLSDVVECSYPVATAPGSVTSGSDRIQHSTCELQFRGEETVGCS